MGLLLGGLCGWAAWGQDVKPMAPEAHPAFEVATVKPSDPADQSQGFHLNGHDIYMERETVQNMIMLAYGVHPRQILNAPDWVSREELDVRGVPNVDGQPSWKQYQEMVQKLLVERFGLKTHTEKRDMTVYALRAAKGGPKVVKTASAPDALSDSTGDGRMMRYTAISMNDFAHGLESLVDRPVVDQTGLQARYDFTLRWAPEGTPSSDPDAAQPLFSAMPEQLGLKLEATKAPTEVMVIDHVDRPTAN